MQEIQGQAKTVRQLMSVKYAIDYYQREYKWETKQIQELLEDLTETFLEDYRKEHSPIAVKDYGRYFLGSIIISKKYSTNYIVDGQQRLTSLTLLLLFLRNQQENAPRQVAIDNLIYSEQYGTKSFNIDVDECEPAMLALFDQQSMDDSNTPDSVRTILARYADIGQFFPDEVSSQALPFFIDWLIDNVHLVEITAFSDDHAYTIFETMNDRGLSLSPTDMLKGFLLSSIKDTYKRTEANDQWKLRVQGLQNVGKEGESDFFKAWLRGQYAYSIRERNKNAKPGDFDRIGTEFHRWVRDHSDSRGQDRLILRESDDFFAFIRHDFDFFSRQYLRLMEASRGLVPGLEHVLYNAKQGFTLQHMLLLAPLSPSDSEDDTLRKQRLVAMYLDILLSRRVLTGHRNTYSSMYYGMFLATRQLRGLSAEGLAHKLRELYEAEAAQEENGLAPVSWLGLHSQNRSPLHLILARLTDYVDQESGEPSSYLKYVNEVSGQRFEVEHIWADKPEQHLDEFSDPNMFRDRRNRLGGLLLLPKSFNASFGDLPYEQKQPHYLSQNLLARSLHPQCYERNPGFVEFAKRSGLPFRAHEQFYSEEIEMRQDLYCALAERIWHPDQLLHEVGG
ncbi:MAG: DUF262 domain-containing protein [Acidobacteria bacterium]|nr:DUF262 domain-containing protein [Acidobacteriota bacterium]